MSLMITDECIACDACREECPTLAIEEGDPIYVIDQDRCTECVGYYDEPSCISVCPVDCIVPDPDNVESVEELKHKYEQIESEN
ncbi:MAG: YfhL family 4Fe-4S dicluster ferredoxin [Campylobacterales bacterium]|nr:YfhL family 4Fe-4S dicluster ferredoxin [Campylobacterales bacterium]